MFCWHCNVVIGNLHVTTWYASFCCFLRPILLSSLQVYLKRQFFNINISCFIIVVCIMFTLEPNMKWIEWTIAEIWPFEIFRLPSGIWSWCCCSPKMTSRHVAGCPCLPPCQIWWQYLKWRTSYCDFPFFKMAAGRHLGFCCSPKIIITARCGLTMATSTPNWVRISAIGAELWRFSFFQNGGRPPFWILLLVKNDVTARCGLAMPTTTPNLVTISQTAVELLWFSVFQDGGRPTSWIWSNRLIGPPTMAHWRS